MKYITEALNQLNEDIDPRYWWSSTEFKQLFNYVLDISKDYVSLFSFQSYEYKLRVPVYYSDTQKFAFPKFRYSDNIMKDLIDKITKFIHSNHLPFDFKYDKNVHTRIHNYPCVVDNIRFYFDKTMYDFYNYNKEDFKRFKNSYEK